MLQQTQVDRVVPFYTHFLKKFPTAKKLGAAPLGEVLKAWQGLGYNRRAKMLHAAAKRLTVHVPTTIAELEVLSGVGPYTARAVAAFAYNQDVVFVETNIRTAVIQHFFSRRKQVADSEIMKVLEQALPKGKAREWYSALMDYGASLKRQGVSHNPKMKGYAKQKAFKGSLREVRGALLRTLIEGPAEISQLSRLFPKERKVQVTHALHALEKEGLVEKQGRHYELV